MSNENEVTRLHLVDSMKDDVYVLAVAGETIGTVAYDLALPVMLGRMTPQEAVARTRGRLRRQSSE